jgi:hypothetical protein
MEAEQLIAPISGTLLLIGIVAASVAMVLWRKQPRRPRPRPEREWHWNGMVFDTRAISPRVQQVRNDYLAAFHRRQHPLFHPATLLEAARRMVAGLAYFRGIGDERLNETETASPSNDPKAVQRRQSAG